MKSKFHPLSVFFVAAVFMIITFNTEDPLVLISQLCFFTLLLTINGEGAVLKRNFILFIPFLIITTLINTIFSSEGSIVILNFFNKSITLEALIYGFVFSFKLFLVILTFSFIGIFIDSDRSLSFFSSRVPKSAFMLLISFKLFPSMRNYLHNLREVYTMRGVSFQERKLRDKIKNLMPIISVMLENTMEASFDLGEAAYVRGFFSGKRSCYDKQSFRRKDYAVTISALILVVLYSVIGYLVGDEFSIYYSSINNIVSKFSLSISTALILMALIFYICIREAGDKK